MKFLIGTASIIILLGLVCPGVLAQSPSDSGDARNFSHSKNPPAKTKTKQKIVAISSVVPNTLPATAIEPETENAIGADEAVGLPVSFESVASKTKEIAREQNLLDLKPTEIYKVGAGDVLFISLQESKSNYFTVMNDGNIDYPLAGGLVLVEGLTVDEIADRLRKEIQLFEDPEVSVSVREHASHEIDVSGMVGRAGKHYLQREAMPLYVIRARAVAESGVTKVLIKRSEEDELVIDADTPEFDDTLVYPGDIIEFTSSERLGAQKGFVYLGGAVKNAGRFVFIDGITLTQAIMTAGGVADENVKKVAVTRKDARGFLQSVNYKLSDILKGKSIDPELRPGDMVEVSR